MDQKYEIIKRIGGGAQAEVYSAKNKETDEQVAIKSVEFDCIEDTIPSSVLRETSILKRLNHPCILSFQEVMQGSSHLHMIFELMGQDLFSFIGEGILKRDSELRKSFLKQILEGLAVIHANGFIHRDLCSANCLVDKRKRNVKIADFGLAREAVYPSLAGFSKTGQTYFYGAPEQLLNPALYSFPVDIWSVGCMFAEMVLVEPLFEAPANANLLHKIFSQLDVPTKEWLGLQLELSDLSKLTAEYTRLKEEVSDSLGSSGTDLLVKLLCLDPAKRISAEEALEHQYFD